MHPGRVPVRVLAFRPRQKAYLPAPVPTPSASSGLLLRRGQIARRHPSRRWRFPRRPKAYLTYGGGGGAISAAGPVGIATFVLSLQAGTKAIYGWSTAIYTSHSGGEQRESRFGTPKRRFEGVAFLVDSEDRDVRGALQRGAASGATFDLAVPFEALVITADSPASTVSVAVAVGSTTDCDWALPGQRVVIVGSVSVVNAVIQSVTSTTITVVTADSSWNLSFATLGTSGRVGDLVMPIVPILLNPEQGFSCYPVTVDLWTIHAQARTFGWVGVDAMGIGAEIVTYTAGAATPVSGITDEDLLIWDRPNMVEDTATGAMLSGSETVDLGALPFGIGSQTVPVWGRSLKLQSTSEDWQWFKAFIRHVRGRQGAFLLSTNRPDLVFDSFIGNGIKVRSASVVGSGDYVSWYASIAHRRLAIVLTDGTTTYVTVISPPVDNGDGTLTLLLDTGVAGSVAMISFLEQVRFERDEIEVTWDGDVFFVDEVVLAVQEAIITLPRVMFDTIVELHFSGVPPTPAEFTLPAGGKSYWVRVYDDRTRLFGGVNVAGGPVEGMVVVVGCVNNNAFGIHLVHEDTTFAANHRMALAGSTDRTATDLHVTLYYDSGTSRWIQIG